MKSDTADTINTPNAACAWVPGRAMQQDCPSNGKDQRRFGKHCCMTRTEDIVAGQADKVALYLTEAIADPMHALIGCCQTWL